ncbi:30S ribosomal protein S17 [Candidatus Falkowbacteria bacterium CG10_big_fil_rev_8_21_14_0_10_39_11]|uniref:Small ribosomal subunit protein uS17 n=1 Tax=Candidatus Falkowbacteria bacterium CG10_big_fil_rev_8_21_14_0_10_39_11 TaxID=1974565 RepID=A0A2H0V3M9_9BACT|nr:MAG: 30S ribosomal protein S17 [Candidatus Falkowbacteria bacterium CG10_big_fil_rev_8_21_14_0_10_39_11]
MSEVKATIKRKFTGEVVSVSMDKTIAVRVDSVQKHPVYNKMMKRSKKFLVHDEAGKSKLGQVVEFVECRPISRHKRWRLVNKVK